MFTDNLKTAVIISIVSAILAVVTYQVDDLISMSFMVFTSLVVLFIITPNVMMRIDEHIR